MASCPPSTSGRECIEQCHQLRVLPSGSGRWGVAGQRLLPARQQRRSNKKAGVQAALTMAEEMVSETKSSERRQIQQMLNRLVPWLVPARTLCIFSKFLTCRSSLSTVCCVLGSTSQASQRSSSRRHLLRAWTRPSCELSRQRRMSQ